MEKEDDLWTHQRQLGWGHLALQISTFSGAPWSWGGSPLGLSVTGHWVTLFFGPTGPLVSLRRALPSLGLCSSRITSRPFL